MGNAYGIPTPAAHVDKDLRPPARYLVLIEAAGSAQALLFLETREQVAEFDAMAGGESLGDLVENRGDDPFDIPLVEMRIPGRQAGNQLGLGHRSSMGEAVRPRDQRFKSLILKQLTASSSLSP